MSADRDAFCRHLKHTRVGSGLTLEAVAGTTKINVSLLAGLERGDLSRWPNGIFRRAFVREYASAIGLRPEEVVGQFRQLFPEEGDGAPAASARPAARDDQNGLRLTLVPERRWWLAPTLGRTIAALVDVLAVAAAGAFLAWAVGFRLSPTIAVVALVYYPASMMCAETTLAFAWLSRRVPVGTRVGSLTTSAEPATAARPHLVFRRRADGFDEEGSDRASSQPSLRAASQG